RRAQTRDLDVAGAPAEHAVENEAIAGPATPVADLEPLAVVAARPGDAVADHHQRGRVAPDGTLVMIGNGIAGSSSYYGQRFEIRYGGRWTGDRFVLHGMFGGR